MKIVERLEALGDCPNLLDAARNAQSRTMTLEKGVFRNMHLKTVLNYMSDFGLRSLEIHIASKGHTPVPPYYVAKGYLSNIKIVGEHDLRFREKHQATIYQHYMEERKRLSYDTLF